MPLFVLSPASLAHSAIFAGYYSYLSLNVVANRFRSGIKDAKDTGNDEKTFRAMRAHGNFGEYTPFAITLLFLAELNGAPTAWVHAGYVTLFASRVSASVALLLSPNKFTFPLRGFGFFGTVVVILGTGLYNLGLGYEPLKSFLGIQ